MGRVKRIDATRDRIRVEDSLGNVLSVDSSLLNDMDMHLNKMYMFIGEIIRKVSFCVSFNSSFERYSSHAADNPTVPAVIYLCSSSSLT